MKQRVEVLQARSALENDGRLEDTTLEATKQDPALPGYLSSLRILFEAHRGAEITLESLQRAIENLIAERDGTWEAKVTKLHVYYGKAIDDMKFEFYKELERAMISGATQPAEQERAIYMEHGDGRFDLEELFEKLGKIGDQDDPDKDKLPMVHEEDAGRAKKEASPTKEKYIGTSSALKIVVPPKLATIEFPQFPGSPDLAAEQRNQEINMLVSNQQPQQGGLLNACCGVDGLSPRLAWTHLMGHPGTSDNDKTFKFHLTFPQQEIKVPFHVIDRYARDVLYRDMEILAADDPRLQPQSVTPPMAVQILSAPSVKQLPPSQQQVQQSGSGELSRLGATNETSQAESFAQPPVEAPAEGVADEAPGPEPEEDPHAAKSGKSKVKESSSKTKTKETKPSTRSGTIKRSSVASETGRRGDKKATKPGVTSTSKTSNRLAPATKSRSSHLDQQVEPGALRNCLLVPLSQMSQS
eukprot:Blabericola_migrator_1__1213@NODE_1310_length_4840_cov_138_493400_g882_i0_p2_GENE_NODE_1310_length_4840_cov_138_493400_g882_i0NODE_1310_length_4840_cov_138_493400_g882_i0_p2_ORF_typecomplete_len470_score83_44_NODE_1310_length_4840_cov_138_493400_g882_i011942603